MTERPAPGTIPVQKVHVCRVQSLRKTIPWNASPVQRKSFAPKPKISVMVRLNATTDFVSKMLQQLWIAKMKILVPSTLAIQSMDPVPTHLQRKAPPVRMGTPVQKIQSVPKGSAQEHLSMDVSLVVKPQMVLAATVASAKNVCATWTPSAAIFTGTPRV